jgi:3-deoxy-manno-octulosonate cytidylyltransferase (CMP-KDO synthetase)
VNIKKPKIIGVIPARMEASRFPGKPLMNILGMPMLEHVYIRSSYYEHWDSLVIATCNDEIREYAIEREMPVMMTGNHHTRALDRVAEAVEKLAVDMSIDDEDIVVCVQGDEPMLRPDMIDEVISPIVNKGISATILAMHITEESVWLNPDTVKIIHNNDGEVLYTSRAPVPYSKGPFNADLFARRIYGIFAFKWKYLKLFTNHEETRLERLEACDSNRILDMGFRQYISLYPSIKSFSVDSPADISLVEEHMKDDAIWNKYKNYKND